MNIPISYSSGTSSWYKALASTFDVSTTGDVLIVFFYVDDKSNIATGSDGVSVIITDENGTFTDYSQYDFNKTNITQGEWYPLICTSLGSPDAQGTNKADLTAIKTIKLQVKTTGSYTGDSLRMDDWIYASDANHEKSVETGYPTINTTLHTVKWVTKYSTADANGFIFRRIFLKNSGGMSYFTGTYNEFNKSNVKELRFFTIQKVRNA